MWLCIYVCVYVYSSHGYVYKYIQAHHCPTKVRVKNDSITVKDLTPGHVFRLPILCLVQAPKQVCLSCLALPSKEVGDWVSRKKSPRTSVCEEPHLAVFLKKEARC